MNKAGQILECTELFRKLCFFVIAIDLWKTFPVQTLTLEDGRPGLVVTDLAENKVYMKFSNWWDQIVLHGALPFLVLAVSNIRYSAFSPIQSEKSFLKVFMKVFLSLVKLHSFSITSSVISFLFK